MISCPSWVTIQKIIEHVIVTLLAFLFAALLAGLSLSLPFLNPVARSLADFSLIDIYFQAMHDAQEPDESHIITIVDISDVHDRSRIADMIDSINQAQPAVVAFDVIFDGLQGDEEGSMTLLEKIGEVETPRFAYMMRDYDPERQSFTTMLRSFFNVDDLNLEGYVNTPESTSGHAIRTFSLQRVFLGDTLPSFAVQIVSAYNSQFTPAPTHGHTIGFTPVDAPSSSTLDLINPSDELLKDHIIDFTPTLFPVVPYNQIGHATDLLRDHIVLVGATRDLVDTHVTSVGRMSGVNLIAYKVQTLLENKNIHYASSFLQWLITFLLVFATQVWNYYLYNHITHSQRGFWKFGAVSQTYMGIANTLWLVLITFGNFLVFQQLNVSFDMLWLLMAIAFCTTASGCYKGVVTVIARRYPNSICARSVYCE